MPIILILLSVLPVILLGRYIYKNDFEKEPKGLLVGLFLMGFGSIALTLVLTFALEIVFPFFSPENENSINLFELIPYIFIGVALIEEFSKWIFSYLIGYHTKEFNHAYDAIVYSTFVALGFACIENILYVFMGGIGTAFTRAITAVPGHACFGVIMGFYLGLAKTAERNQNKKVIRTNLIKSLLFPILAHGLYDYFIFATATEAFFKVPFILFVIFLFSVAPKLIRQLAAIHYDIQLGVMTPEPVSYMATPMGMPQYTYQFCPICGERVVGRFCSRCGHDHFQG